MTPADRLAKCARARLLPRLTEGEARKAEEALRAALAAYDAAPRPQPLSEEQIRECMTYADWPPQMMSYLVMHKLQQFARAIERAHGITAKD